MSRCQRRRRVHEDIVSRFDTALIARARFQVDAVAAERPADRRYGVGRIEDVLIRGLRPRRRRRQRAVAA
jgi:hypothetical protein